MTANDHKPHKGIKQKTIKQKTKRASTVFTKCRHCKRYLHSLGGASSSEVMDLKTATRNHVLMIKISSIVNTGCGSVQKVCRRV